MNIKYEKINLKVAIDFFIHLNQYFDILHSFNAINKFAARSTSEMWWDSTIDIFDQAFKHFNMVGQEIACLAPREREHSPLPTEGLVDTSESLILLNVNSFTSYWKCEI